MMSYCESSFVISLRSEHRSEEMKSNFIHCISFPLTIVYSGYFIFTLLHCEMVCALSHLTLIMPLGGQVKLGLNRITLDFP